MMDLTIGGFGNVNEIHRCRWLQTQHKDKRNNIQCNQLWWWCTGQFFSKRSCPVLFFSLYFGEFVFRAFSHLYFFFFLSSGAAIGKTMAVCTIIISFEGGKKCEGMSVVSGPNVYIIIYMGKKWNDDDEHSPAWLRAIYRDICLPFFSRPDVHCFHFVRWEKKIRFFFPSLSSLLSFLLFSVSSVYTQSSIHHFWSFFFKQKLFLGFSFPSDFASHWNLT